jgi:hypothetical protein
VVTAKEWNELMIEEGEVGLDPNEEALVMGFQSLNPKLQGQLLDQLKRYKQQQADAKTQAEKRAAAKKKKDILDDFKAKLKSQRYMGQIKTPSTVFRFSIRGAYKKGKFQKTKYLGISLDKKAETFDSPSDIVAMDLVLDEDLIKKARALKQKMVTKAMLRTGRLYGGWSMTEGLDPAAISKLVHPTLRRSGIIQNSEWRTVLPYSQGIARLTNPNDAKGRPAQKKLWKKAAARVMKAGQVSSNLVVGRYLCLDVQGRNKLSITVRMNRNSSGFNTFTVTLKDEKKRKVKKVIKRGVNKQLLTREHMSDAVRKLMKENKCK